MRKCKKCAIWLSARRSFGEVKGNRSLFFKQYAIVSIVLFTVFENIRGIIIFGREKLFKEGHPPPPSSRKPVNVDLVKLNGLNPDNN